MEKIRRNERMSAMMKILSGAPNRIFTLSHFCELFGAAKSTMSEDIDILREVVTQFGLGELDTVTGLQVVKIFKELCEKEGVTIVMTTHDTGLMEVGDAVIELEDGEQINAGE